VFGGDDYAGSPDYAARGEARPGVHSYYGTASLFDSGGQFVGESH
jgi:hypothetical protein